jgi:serine/threonine protein kinase
MDSNTPNNDTPWNEIEYQCKLGDGFAGSVYLGLYRNKEFAVKKIILLNKESQFIFSNEIIYMYLLSHGTNIVKLYDFQLVKEDNYFVYHIMMELGTCNLKDFLNNNKNHFHNYQNLLNFTSQMLNGIYYLNSNNIAHRDLKLENILYFENEETFKLNDFGCAVDIVNNDRRIHRGYIAYSPPEIKFNFNKIYNYDKSDIYSLGVILLLCLGIIDEPNILMQYKRETDYNSFKASLLDKIKLLHSQQEFVDFIDKILEYKIDNRPNIEDLCMMLGIKINKDKSLTKSNFNFKTIYLKNLENYVANLDSELTLFIDKDKNCKFEILPIENGKYLIKSNDKYIASTLINVNKIVLSDKVSPLEEWIIIYYEPQNVYFFRNHNLHFLSINGDKVCLSGLLGENEKFIIE